MINMRLWCREDEQRPLVTDLSWAVSHFISRYGRPPTKVFVCPLEFELFLNNHHSLDVVENKDVDKGWFGLW